MLWASWVWHSGSGGYPHWLPLGLFCCCCCCCIFESLLSAICKRKDKFTLDSLEFQEEFFSTQLLVLQVKISMAAFDNLSMTGYTNLLSAASVNQIDLDYCCSLWLVSVSSADVWKCLTGVAWTHQVTEPGEKRRVKPWGRHDGRRGYS